jgi:polysaccharide export outer membrane protein
MDQQASTSSLNGLYHVAVVLSHRELPDDELLKQFVRDSNQAAFTALIERHGPMVLGVCRRALPNSQDAEDVCQATFLVLVRRAESIRKGTSLSSWLHGVACRLARDFQRDQGRRRKRERCIAHPVGDDLAAAAGWRELLGILDEELNRLPEHYRAPLILTYLEGHTRDEAAELLGTSSGSLKGLLERARK